MAVMLMIGTERWSRLALGATPAVCAYRKTNLKYCRLWIARSRPVKDVDHKAQKLESVDKFGLFTT